jgi:hypothetical protein
VDVLPPQAASPKPITSAIQAATPRVFITDRAIMVGTPSDFSRFKM